jgi:hypothetical protein
MVLMIWDIDEVRTQTPVPTSPIPAPESEFVSKNDDDRSKNDPNCKNFKKTLLKGFLNGMIAYGFLKDISGDDDKVKTESSLRGEPEVLALQALTLEDCSLPRTRSQAKRKDNQSNKRLGLQ